MRRETAANPSDGGPAQVVPFPSKGRAGHAGRVADQLKRARSNREADWILNRALSAHHDQMGRAGLSLAIREVELETYRNLIHQQCLDRKSRWIPSLPVWGDRNPTGDNAA